MRFWQRPVFWLFSISFAALAFLFYPMIIEGQVYTYRDSLAGMLPLRHFWVQSIHNLELPEWNPYLAGGMQFWGDFKNAVLSPFNLPFLFFDADQIVYAYNWVLLAHFPLLFSGMRWFLRTRGIGRQASIVFALVYCLSGAVVTAFSMPGLLAAQAILPFFAIFALRWSAGEIKYSSMNTLGLLVCLALPVYSVLPEVSFYFGFFLFVLLLRKPSATKTVSFFLIGGSSLLATLPVTLPGIDFMLQAASPDLDRHYLKYAMSVRRLVEFFLLNPFGANDTGIEYWGKHLSRTARYPLFFSLYIGSTVLTGLIAFAFCHRRRYRPVLALLSGIGLFMFASEVPYIGEHLYYATSFGHSFRSPEKLVIFLSFVLVLTMAHGWQRLFAILRAGYRLPRFVLFWFASLLVLFFVTQFTVYVYGKGISLDVWRIFMILAYGQSVILLLAAAKPFLLRHRWLLLAPLLAGELLWHARANTWLQPPEILSSTMAAKIQSSLRDRQHELRQGAAFRTVSRRAETNAVFDKNVLFERLDEIGKVGMYVAESLISNVGMLHQLSSATSAGVIRSEAQKSLWDQLYPTVGQKILNMTGAYYQLFSNINLQPGVELKINQQALPFVFSPKQVLTIEDGELTKKTIFSDEFDEQTQAIVRAPPVVATDNNHAEVASVTRESPREIAVQIKSLQTKAPLRYLLINEGYDRHWRAYVAGKPLPVHAANLWAMAVELPKSCRNGCDLTLVYRNSLIRLGLLLGVFYLLIHLWVYRQAIAMLFSGGKESDRI